MKRFHVQIIQANEPPICYTAIARHVVDVVLAAAQQFGIESKIRVSVGGAV
jgi:hypothetical protein